MCLGYVATTLLKMHLKYKPEDKAARKERVLKRAQVEAGGKSFEAKKPIMVNLNPNTITICICNNNSRSNFHI